MSMTEIITDAALFERFGRRRDEAAFAALVQRHGPMVRATCRRVLGERPDVDDAFQAVFMILANKATSIRRRRLPGPWLHTVALRTAQKARNAIQRQAQREKQVATMVQTNKRRGNEADWLTWLDEELARLSAAFRDPLILCELEGCSRAEAAATLQIPEGTVSSRFAHGKEMLRERLRRRGAIVSAIALGLVLSEPAQAAGLGGHSQHGAGGHQRRRVGARDGPCSRSASRHVPQETHVCRRCGSGDRAKHLGLGTAWHIAVLHAQVAGPQAKAEQDKLQGTWDVVRAEMFGKEPEGEEGDNIRKGKS